MSRAERLVPAARLLHTRKFRSRCNTEDSGLTSEGNEILAFRLGELRQKREFTQRHVADLAGIPYETYCGYERGESRAPFARIRKIAVALDASMDYLAGFTDDPTPTQTPRSPDPRPSTQD